MFDILTLKLPCTITGGQGSVLSIVTFYGLDGLEFATQSDRTIKTTSEAHPASASKGIGVLSWAKLAAV
jgi:hypothetical protein